MWPAQELNQGLLTAPTVQVQVEWMQLCDATTTMLVRKWTRVPVGAM